MSNFQTGGDLQYLPRRRRQANTNSVAGAPPPGQPAPPTGFAYVLGADGNYLKGADGNYLLVRL